MSDKEKQSSSSPPDANKPLHPVYSINNIHTKIRTLDGVKITYSTWVKLFKLNARGFDVLNHIDGTPPPAKTDETYEEWAKIDAIVLQWIYVTVTDELLKRVLTSESTAQEAWNKMQTIFLNNKNSRAASLEHAFSTMTLASCSSLTDYFQKLKEISEQLNDVDHPVTESRLVLQMVRGLPPEYDTVAAFINQSQTTWDDAIQMVDNEQRRQASRPTAPASASHTVLAAPGHQPQSPSNTNTPNPPPSAHPAQNFSTNAPRQSNRGRGGRDRFHRGGRGRGRYYGGGYQNYTQHGYGPPRSNTQQNQNYWWASIPPCPHPAQSPWHTSWSRPGSYNQTNHVQQPTASPQAHFAGYGPPPQYQSATTPFQAVNPLEPTDLGAALSTLTMNPSDQQWYMDTGASSHITSNPGKINIPISNSINANIFVGNGHSLPITGSGNGFHQIPNKTFHLNNILCAPDVIKDLLSVRKFTRDNHVKIEFDPNGFTLKDLQTGHPISRHDSTGDLYPFTPPTQAFLTPSSNKWHERLGHPGSQVLQFMSSHFNFPCNKDSFAFCDSCHRSNSKRLPFYESHSFTFAPFDIIHCDLWTSPVHSNSSYKYYMVLVDNYSNYVWVYPLKFKSETFSTFVKFHKLIRTPFQKKIKTFQCDLGGEFDNNQFHNFATQNGLVFRFSCPQTSSQNGRSERMIRRLNDIIRTLLVHAHLPPVFWVEALHTAAYLHNILPTKRLNFNTPTFALFHCHPTYDHLRVLGCACYPNMSATQPHKLHPRSVQCIFLGYPPNFRGYRCFDPQTGKVYISRHVEFDESTFPFPTIVPSTSYTFLDEDPITLPTYQFPSTSSPIPPQIPVTHHTPYSPPLNNSSTTTNVQSPLAESHAPLNHPPNNPTHPLPSNNHPMTTRSKAGITKPNPKFALHTTNHKISPLPPSPHKALQDPNWQRAMLDEYKALIENDTWELVPRPSSHPVIRCMWLFRHKFKPDGNLDRYKARLVVNGKSQTVGIDCADTFSPVVKPATIRTVLSIALSRGWAINQLDVKNAFLHGNLEETVFMHQPPGFVDPSRPNFVCRLRKSLYGLKQAPRAWFTRFSTFLTSHGFKGSLCDTSLFIYQSGDQVAYLLLYVDDIILTASSPTLLSHFIQLLSTEFSMTDMGALHHFLGITVTRDRHGMFLSQSQYAKDILHRANMDACKPCATPVDTASKLSLTDGELLPDGSIYRSLAGALQYLTFTRPDISYAVQQVCLFMHAPREPHFNFMKRILRYLQGTIDYGIRLHASPSTSLTAYSDADWGGCPDSRRSTSGYCVYMGNNLLSWSSKRQPTVSRSSAKAEYRGVANAVAETSWLRNLLLELGVSIHRATLIYCDNISAVYLSENPVQHQRTKHVEIDLHFVREKVKLGHVRVLHVPSEFQYADIFTKGLSRQLFESFRSSLNVHSVSRSN
ncbi:hypothetical protein QVD17_08921 [Tagetes erecta]|uniref:Integrase catalytic domain-containing protein n=1 Tax=Tagetes erecta TaxID=13708 RepID=A0AAD8KYE6_TARER|nr:hypothetical protein QVD17_08921 [Tagetes erecta]